MRTPTIVLHARLLRALAALIAIAACSRPSAPADVPAPVDAGDPPDAGEICGPFAIRQDTPFFHVDRARTGWNDREALLTRATVTSGRFGPLWRSPAPAQFTVDGRAWTPRMYASPLYVDDVRVEAGRFTGTVLSLVIGATTANRVFAVNAFERRCGGVDARPGEIVWDVELGPATMADPDGGIPLGIVSTPAIDLSARPPRVYVTALVGGAGWRVFALELASGRTLAGWSVAIDDGALASVNANGPARFFDARSMLARGALNLSPSGDRLYVTFGGYGGWIVAVDTARPALTRSFSAVPSNELRSNGGMWGAGGPAVAADGSVFMNTGANSSGLGDAQGVWGNSLLRWTGSLELNGTYSPWHYCVLDQRNMDLAASTPALIPALDPTRTATPNLVTFGSKPGTMFLVNADALPGRLDRRPPCSTDPASDRSLLPPTPQFGALRPLHVFMPYSEVVAEWNTARMRSTPAVYRSAGGTTYVMASGSSRTVETSEDPIAPGLVRLRVVTAPGQPAYLVRDAEDASTVLFNPGAPLVTSHDGRDAIVWVVDPQQRRSAPVYGPEARRPALLAFDAATMRLVWRSADMDLEVGGKYVTPAAAHGVIFVGTDRIEAFGLRN